MINLGRNQINKEENNIELVIVEPQSKHSCPHIEPIIARL